MMLRKGLQQLGQSIIHSTSWLGGNKEQRSGQKKMNSHICVNCQIWIIRKKDVNKKGNRTEDLVLSLSFVFIEKEG